MSCPPSLSQLEAEQAVDSSFSAQSDLIDLKGFPQREQYCWTRRDMLYKQPLWVGRCLWREVTASQSCLYWNEGGEAGPGIQQAFLQLRGIGKGKAPEGFTKRLAWSQSQKSEISLSGSFLQIPKEKNLRALPPWSCGFLWAGGDRHATGLPAIIKM